MSVKDKTTTADHAQSPQHSTAFLFFFFTLLSILLTEERPRAVRLENG